MFGTTALIDFNDNAPFKQVIKGLLSMPSLTIEIPVRETPPRMLSPDRPRPGFFRETTRCLRFAIKNLLATLLEPARALAHLFVRH